MRNPVAKLTAKWRARRVLRNIEDELFYRLFGRTSFSDEDGKEVLVDRQYCIKEMLRVDPDLSRNQEFHLDQLEKTLGRYPGQLKNYGPYVHLVAEKLMSQCKEELAEALRSVWEDLGNYQSRHEFASRFPYLVVLHLQGLPPRELIEIEEQIEEGADLAPIISWMQRSEREDHARLMEHEAVVHPDPNRVYQTSGHV